ncbi:Voltage-dependent calcium channel subunit alpha-2/delta-3 [Larimichthys crocea]|uniref:Uncharacterized protein n=1 Tax=Larimichthys crocea TaxID=215358 RepID=A0ACD3Q7S9_LARCR|nr:Voltage-dependent calcium channel subunit alpha-2/delta-3 [Larimichthys crocea]
MEERVHIPSVSHPSISHRCPGDFGHDGVQILGHCSTDPNLTSSAPAELCEVGFTLKFKTDYTQKNARHETCTNLQSEQHIAVSRGSRNRCKPVKYFLKSKTMCFCVCVYFLRVSLFDYQAMCKMNSHSVSSARPLLSPFYGLASALKWFLSNFLLFLLEFNICGFWHTEHFADASAHKKKGDILQPCDTEYPSFVYEPSVKETNSIIKCGRCQKMFVVQQIPESNLLMLVVQADCDCSRQYPPITMQPKEVKYIL